MLFVSLMKPVAGTTDEQRTGRRLDWTYPEGMRPVGEYWLLSPDPTVVLISEADNVEVMMSASFQWSDLFEITVFPAVTAEAGIAHAREAFAAAVA
jgi:hypothetical protein